MNTFKREHHMDGLLVLLLFGVFATCILLVLLTGADAYSRLTERDDETYSSRTTAQYIATKVRQAAAAGAVSVAPFGDGQALQLSEEIEGETYITRIYYYEGYIRELFTWAGMELTPADGSQVLPAQGLAFDLQDELLSVRIDTENGQQLDLKLGLRGDADLTSQMTEPPADADDAADEPVGLITIIEGAM